MNIAYHGKSGECENLIFNIPPNTDASIDIHLSRDCSVNFFTISPALGNCNLNLQFFLEGTNAAIAHYHLGKLQVGQQQTLHSKIFHLAPHTTSLQHLKNGLFENASANFQGEIHIAPQAKFASADQLCNNLLMAKSASAKASPTLYIENDEVKCRHGATVGPLEPEQLYYLMIKGIPQDRATQLVLQAFENDILDKIPQSSLNLVEVSNVN